MEEKQITKKPSDLIEEIERCIERFEKLEKKIQQPWRRCGVDDKASVNNAIKKLNDLIQKVRGGRLGKEQAEIAFMAMDTIADLIESELDYQNMQKSLGEEITPFGQMEI